MDRRLRALAQVEARELKSLETEIVKEQRVKTRARGGGNRMPALTLDLKPRGRRDAGDQSQEPPRRTRSAGRGGENPVRAAEKDPFLAGGLHPRRRGWRRRRVRRRGKGIVGWRQADRPHQTGRPEAQTPPRSRPGYRFGSLAREDVSPEFKWTMMSDELVNQEKVTILEGDPVTQFWLRGRVNRYPAYTFLAKVYDVGSVFGIGQGRISKLQVWRGDREVMSYDRGWDQVPTNRRDRNALREILAGFPDKQRNQANNEETAPERDPGDALHAVKRVCRTGAARPRWRALNHLIWEVMHTILRI